MTFLSWTLKHLEQPWKEIFGFNHIWSLTARKIWLLKVISNVKVVKSECGHIYSGLLKFEQWCRRTLYPTANKGPMQQESIFLPWILYNFFIWAFRRCSKYIQWAIYQCYLKKLFSSWRAEKGKMFQAVKCWFWIGATISFMRPKKGFRP